MAEQTLYDKAVAIRDEQQESKNTAIRIGSLFIEILGLIGDTPESVAKLQNVMESMKQSFEKFNQDKVSVESTSAKCSALYDNFVKERASLEGMANTIGCRVLRFGGFIADEVAVTDSLFYVTEEEILMSESLGRFVGVRRKNTFAIDYCILSSSHTNWGVATTIPPYSEAPYIAYSSTYGFCRTDGRVLYTNSDVPDTFIYEKGKTKYYICGDYKLGWNSYGYIEILENIPDSTAEDVYTYNFDLIGGVGYAQYACNRDVEQRYINITTGKIYIWGDDDVLIEKVDMKLGTSDFINGGIINISSTGSIESIYNNLETGAVALCIIGDSNGNYPSTESRVNVNAAYTIASNYFFSKNARGANVGDMLMITKQEYLSVDRCALRIIPLNDSKVPTDGYYGTEGVMTPSDKERINKTQDRLDNVENYNLKKTKYSYGTPLDECLKTGVLAYTSATVNGITANWSLFVDCSVDTDGGGYFHLIQVAVCRDLPFVGMTMLRLGFYKEGMVAEFSPWKEITNDTTVPYKTIVWDSEKEPANGGSSMDNFTTKGTYMISGYSAYATDMLPITTGINFSAYLVVTVDETSGSVGQHLTLSSKEGQETKTYVRTRTEETRWTPWKVLQGMQEVGQVTSLDGYIDNGIYSGVYTDGSSSFETFVLITINNYAVAATTNSPRRIAQLKYAVNIDGTISVKKRLGSGSSPIEFEVWDNVNQ